MTPTPPSPAAAAHAAAGMAPMAAPVPMAMVPPSAAPQPPYGSPHPYGSQPPFAPPPPAAPPPPPPPDDDSGFSLLDILDLLLDHRWVIAGFTAVGLALGLGAARVAVPVYSSNMVLQVEQGRGQAGVLFSTATSLFENTSTTAAELEIMRSRMVLGQAVDNLQLTLYVQPKYLPVVGRYLANRATAPSSPGFLGQPGYVWGNEQLRVSAFELPASLEGTMFSVVATGGNGFELRTQDGNVLARGQAGTELAFTIPGHNGARLKVEEIVGLPGAEFMLSRRSRQAEVLSLQNRLRMEETARGSGVVRVSLQGTERRLLPMILNEVGTQYVRQDMDRRAEEAQKAMTFLGGLLPQIRKELETAEGVYNQFRVRQGTFSLSDEASTLLNRSVSLQARLFELRQTRRELDNRFTAEHPQVRLVEEERKSIEAELARVRQAIDKLPALEQDTLRLTRDVKVNTELYTSLLNTYQQLQLAKEGKVGNVRIVDPAEPPLGPIGPNRQLMILLGLLGGLAVGLGAAVLRNVFNTGIKDPGDIEVKAQLPLLATVPHSDAQKALATAAGGGAAGAHVLAVTQPNDGSVESLRSLRTAMQFAMLDAANNVLLITGPTPGIGKSFISLNLAAVLGAGGKRVLLVDMDMRKGRLHQYLGLKRQGGFSEVVSGTVALDAALHRAVVPQVDFLSTGTLPPNPAELLLAATHHGVLGELQARYDIVIVDTPPVLVAADTAVIAPYAGTVLMVARALVTGLGELEESKRRLAQTGVQVKGVVFNDLDLSRRRYGYGYGYGYKYGYRYGRYRYTQYKY